MATEDPDFLNEYFNTELRTSKSDVCYERFIVNKLSLTSLTFNWLEDKKQTENSVAYRYVYSTYSNGKKEQYVVFAEFKKSDEEQGKEIITDRITFKVKHPKHANRVIRSPTQPRDVATKTIASPINIYRQGEKKPIKILNGHTCEGFGIDWKSHGLASTGYDGQVIAWKDPYEQESFTYKGNYRHSNRMGDIKWINPNTLIAISDDGYMSLWDMRSKSFVYRCQWADRQLTSMDVNRTQRQLVVVGTASGLVKIWDLRSNMSTLHNYESHTESVVRVQWSPHDANIFASASADKTVCIWDVMRVGQDQNKKGKSSELVFTHQGHQGSVSDLSWNPYVRMIGSSEIGLKTLQFYQFCQQSKENPYNKQFNKNKIFGE